MLDIKEVIVYECLLQRIIFVAHLLQTILNSSGDLSIGCPAFQ